MSERPSSQVDFTKWITKDPDKKYLISPEKVSWTHVDRIIPIEVCKDYTENHFKDFAHTFSAQLTEIDNKSPTNRHMITLWKMWDHGGNVLSVYAAQVKDSNDKWNIVFFQRKNGKNLWVYSGSYQYDINKNYFFTVNRIAEICRITVCEDDKRALKIEDSGFKAGVADYYRFLSVAAGINVKVDRDDWSSGSIENLQIAKIVSVSAELRAHINVQRAGVEESRGYTFWRSGNLPEALKSFEASLQYLYEIQKREDKSRPKGALYHMIGLIRLGLGEMEEARKSFFCAYIEDLLHAPLGSESSADEAPAAWALKDYFHLSQDEILPIKTLVVEKKQSSIWDKIRDPNQILRELIPKGTVDLKAKFEISISLKLEKKPLAFPTDWEKAIFVGGNYIFHMPTIIKIRNVIKELGYEPIIADEYILPEEYIHHHCMMLLHACKYAIFDVTFPGGQLLEIERATDWIDKDNILLLCTNRAVDTVSKMVQTKGLKIEPFQDFEKDIPGLISNFLLARIEDAIA